MTVYVSGLINLFGVDGVNYPEFDTLTSLYDGTPIVHSSHSDSGFKNYFFNLVTRKWSSWDPIDGSVNGEQKIVVHTITTAKQLERFVHLCKCPDNSAVPK